MDVATTKPQHDVENLYSHTIRLSQENKINAKNTWSLSLIDHIGALVQERAVAENETGPQPATSTNFGLAGCTLDAGVKIYSHRVDSVHINALKIRGGLGKTVDAETDPDDKNNDSTTDRPRRRTRRTGAGATLETKENITQPYGVEQECMVDPLFHKMSSDFDEGGARGMLLNGLSLGPCCELLFDSSEVPDKAENQTVDTPDDNGISSELPDKDENQTGSYPGDNGDSSEPPDKAENQNLATPNDNDELSFDLKAILDEFRPLFTPSTDKFCPTVVAYVKEQSAEVDCSTLDRSHSSAVAQTTNPPSIASENVEHDAPPAFDYTGCDFEDASAPFASAAMLEEQSMIDDIGLDEDDDGDSACGSRQNSFVSTSMDLIEAGISLSNSDYEMLDAKAMVNWTGAPHWKHRMAKPRNQNQAVKRPRGKTAMLLDFFSDAPEVGFRSAFTQAKVGAVELTQASKSKLSAESNLLPEDVHYDTKQLTCLMTRPSLSVSAGQRTLVPSSDETKELDSLANEADFDDDLAPGFDDDEDQVDAPLSDWGLDLVAQPNTVSQQGITYARKAKTVNVRQLKEKLWSDLSADTMINTSSDSSHWTQGRNDDVKHLGTLQDLVANLPNNLPKGALTDVSVSFVFICVLHLANENGLVVEDTENLSDLLVAAPSSQHEESASQV